MSFASTLKPRSSGKSHLAYDTSELVSKHFFQLVVNSPGIRSEQIS